MLFNEQQFKSDAQGIVDYFIGELKKLRTGRATMDLFDNIMVEAYGAMSKLTALSNVVVEDAVSVKVNIWDKNVMPNVEKALREANIGANVIMDSGFIRLKFTPVSEEDRKERVKELGELLEKAKVSIRHLRQKFKEKIEAATGVSEDEQERDTKKLQEVVDNQIADLDKIAKQKEQEILKI